MKKNQIDNLKFKNIVNKLDFKNIFYPTDTSRLLINTSDKYLKPKQKILDLGCGGGIISFCLYKKNYKQLFFLSDIDQKAVELAKKNLAKKKIKAEFFYGDLLKPLVGKKFDIILNDVSGVSSEIAKISPWFKNAIADKRKNGISNLKKIIKNCKLFLNKDSVIILPIISLSNTNEAIKYLNKNMKIVELKKYYWPMPENLKKRIHLIKKIKIKKHIDFEYKYNTWLCYTMIVVCKKR